MSEGGLRHLRARLRAMVTAIFQTEATVSRTERAVSRIEELASTIEEKLRAADSLLETARQVQDDARREVNLVAAEIQGIVANTQNLAGETLAAVNDHRMRSLALADLSRQAVGRMEARQLRQMGARSWHENEFRVYSQQGEDGLLQFLFREIGDVPRTFIEFGVEDYQEANTRFLLLHDRSWSGLVMDGSADNIAAIQTDYVGARYDLKAVAAWITRENINELLLEQGFSGEIGLLSIDIDGNDYWVWEAITAVDPVVVVIEYNYRFGPDICAAVPYDSSFDKAAAHPSCIYYGASLQAMVALGQRKGYAFVGCCLGGVNAFFVRRDHLPSAVPEMDPVAGFVAGNHAEMVDPESGERVKATLERQRDLLLTLPLVMVGKGAAAIDA